MRALLVLVLAVIVVVLGLGLMLASEVLIASALMALAGIVVGYLMGR